MTWLLVVTVLSCCAFSPEKSPSSERPLVFRIAEEKEQPLDPWIAYDKAQHLTFSFLWTLSSQYALEQKAGWRTGRALPMAAGTSVAVGVAKELYDWKVGPTRRFSYRDLVADGLGVVLAVGFILL